MPWLFRAGIRLREGSGLKKVQENKLRKMPFRSLIQVAIPLFLLAAFTLCIVFPDLVPFLQIHVKSYEGLGAESFTLKGQGGKGPAVSFSLKRVPAGIAPAECTDIPGGTVVNSAFMLAETEVTNALWDRVALLSASRGYVLDRPVLPATCLLYTSRRG